ncbi:hypothetical protein [Falsiroseomonas sp. CW058]|uniref:hypothetical protein n=1 Tax=Falsiroseomonas sp. CW058 TaxID=3388664 RepID=UPI003D315F2F
MMTMRPDETQPIPEAEAALLRLERDGAEAEARALRERLGDRLTELGVALREAEAARAAQAAAVAERDAARAERDAARAELAALRASTSWRVTAPLRRLARRLGR